MTLPYNSSTKGNEWFSGCSPSIHVSIDNDNDNDNILLDHNLQIEITIYNSLENQIRNWSGD